MTAPPIRREPPFDGVDAEHVIDPLNLEHCDRCGAHAYIVTVIVSDGKRRELSWCAHHYARYAEALRESGAHLLVDQRERLLAAESTVHA